MSTNVIESLLSASPVITPSVMTRKRSAPKRGTNQTCPFVRADPVVLTMNHPPRATLVVVGGNNVNATPSLPVGGNTFEDGDIEENEETLKVVESDGDDDQE